ncbi:MAG: polysaccharide deacetylase family protein [Myxococcota bacterium]|nr:polysaccharide deacetylase family protein [Myxococcota bacterium]MDW8362150.1 polysaccharide deacetylase family protein [Myxococcales bacterium]
MLAAVSVDLDEVDCYAALHGLPPPAPECAHAVYERAIPRFERLFDAEGLRATFFAIGRDLNHPPAARALARLVEAGHEPANHSATHPYDLTRLPREAMAREVREGVRAIETATGRAPGGFRAPGYTVSDALFEVLRAEGVVWDSSVFPCPVYQAAKLAAMTAMRARGRRTAAVPPEPRMLLAPADPYRVGARFWQRGDGLLELPIGVTRDATGRLPYIGTFVVLGGERGARRLTSLVVGRPFVNLELHGMDLLDADEDGLRWLAPYQPDLRRRAADKELALRAAFGMLREAGYRFVTLSEAARAFGAL